MEPSNCKQVLLRKLRSANTISFRSFMEISLYDPQFGYYTKGKSRVGKNGDFITSVSVGSAFGSILAHRLAQVWEDLNQPNEFIIIEMGANQADLAIDICNEFKSSFSHIPLSYNIVEPIKQLRVQQQTRISEFSHSIQIHSSINSLTPGKGVFLSNELYDAFPVERIKFNGDSWEQLFIEAQGDTITKIWKAIECNELQSFCDSLCDRYTRDYTTEYRPNLNALHQQISEVIEQGMIISIDYGFPKNHYYDPKRTCGTLQTYKNHTKTDDPLSNIGEQDITAHVDFTQLANSQLEAGFNLHDFSSQSRYLTNHGKSWLLNLEQSFSQSTLPLIQQFQTLTHPEMMGGKFRFLETTKGYQTSSPPLTPRPQEIL